MGGVGEWVSRNTGNNFIWQWIRHFPICMLTKQLCQAVVWGGVGLKWVPSFEDECTHEQKRCTNHMKWPGLLCLPRVLLNTQYAGGHSYSQSEGRAGHCAPLTRRQRLLSCSHAPTPCICHSVPLPSLRDPLGTAAEKLLGTVGGPSMAGGPFHGGS